MFFFPIHLHNFFSKSFLPVFDNSAFKRTLCGGKWSLYFTSSTGTNGRYGCCDAGTYMAFPELNPFVKTDACLLVLPNGDGSNGNPGTGLRKVVHDWIAGTGNVEATYGHIRDWDVSHITNFQFLFYNMATGNPDISKWDTGAVINMYCSKSFIE